MRVQLVSWVFELGLWVEFVSRVWRLSLCNESESWMYLLSLGVELLSWICVSSLWVEFVIWVSKLCFWVEIVSSTYKLVFSLTVDFLIWEFISWKLSFWVEIDPMNVIIILSQIVHLSENPYDYNRIMITIAPISAENPIGTSQNSNSDVRCWSSPVRNRRRSPPNTVFHRLPEIPGSKFKMRILFDAVVKRSRTRENLPDGGNNSQ